MNLLSLDTSTKNLSLAVSRGREVLKFRNVTLNRPLDLSIVPAIKKILDSAGTPVDQLDGFAVGLGPGSFTSLRVGLSTVKGLAFGTHKPIVGIPSLDVLAMNGPAQAQVCALCDAKRDLVYACLYEKKGTLLKKKSDYLLCHIQDVLRLVKGKTVFIGDGSVLYKEDIKKKKNILPEFVAEKDHYPQAKNLALLAVERFQRKDWDHAGRLVPLYLYPDHCQIKPGQRDKERHDKP